MDWGENHETGRAMRCQSSKLVLKMFRKALAKTTSELNIANVQLTYIWFGGRIRDGHGHGEVVAIPKDDLNSLQARQLSATYG
jgi:hypothetical protein